jgi:hypothetical protein
MGIVFLVSKTVRFLMDYSVFATADKQMIFLSVEKGKAIPVTSRKGP